MAEDASTTTTTTQEPLVRVQEVVLTDVPQPDKTPTLPVEKDPQTVSETEPEKPLKPVEETVETEASKPSGENDEKVPESGSFKEESTRVADLPENEKKALQELKHLIQEALNKHEFSAPSQSPPKEEKPAPIAAEKEEEKKKKEKAPEPVQEEEKEKETKTEEKVGAKTEEEEGDKKEIPAEEVKESAVAGEAVEDKAPAPAVDDDGAKTVEAIEETIVAVSSSSVPTEQPTAAQESEDAAAPSAEAESRETKDQTPCTPAEEVSIWGIPLLADERSDVVLLKFLRARDFKVKDAFAMIKNTIRWRKEFGIDELMEENLGDDLEKAVYMHGFDKEGHPVCYNIYGEFQNKELYKKTFSDEGKRQNFLRWRIQFLEKSIRKLDFNPGGISTIVQVNDLKNSPGPGKWELRQATKQALQLLQDNYPEFVAKQVLLLIHYSSLVH